LSLGASTVGSGTLTVSAGGSITETGAITQAASAGAATFGVTAAASDILLGQANDFSGTFTVGGTMADLRDLNLRNIYASAAIPSLVGLTNLRNLTLTFDNAALTLPALTLTSGGNLSVSA